MFTDNKILSTVLSTSIPQERSIFAILVHFGPAEVTQVAIHSLLAGTMRPDHIIVVDHAKKTFLYTDTRVVVIRPKRNTGYFGGLQVGFAHALASGARESDLCLLLNNDLVFMQDSLETISQWWDTHGSSRVLAGASLGLVSLVTGRANISSGEDFSTTWRTIPYIHGSCMVGEFTLLTSLQFPVSLFMYWEDVLLSIMIQKKSGVIRCIPGLHAIHNDRSSLVPPSKLFYLVRNGAYVLETHTPAFWRVYWYAINTMRMAYHGCMDGIKHRVIVRSLYDARSKKLGRSTL